MDQKKKQSGLVVVVGGGAGVSVGEYTSFAQGLEVTGAFVECRV